MPWAKVDDKFYDHPKTVAVGTLGAGLFVLALSYASNKLTDGFVPAGMIPRLVSDVDDPIALANSLVKAGLFEQADGGYQIHDYLDYNPSHVEALALREARAEAGRLGGLESGRSKREANEQANAIANEQAKTYPVPVPVPVPMIPDSHTNIDSAASAASMPKPIPQSKREPYTEEQQQFLSKFNAKRFANYTQADTVKVLIEAHPATFWEAVEWAAERGMAVGIAIGAIKKALPSWGKRGDTYGSNQRNRTGVSGNNRQGAGDSSPGRGAGAPGVYRQSEGDGGNLSDEMLELLRTADRRSARPVE